MKIIYKDGHVGECPQEEELHVIRHTAAHVMAQAIKRLFPQADFAYGPATQNGFYYDVDLGEVKLANEDLEAIEKEMMENPMDRGAQWATVHRVRKSQTPLSNLVHTTFPSYVCFLCLLYLSVNNFSSNYCIAILIRGLQGAYPLAVGN